MQTFLRLFDQIHLDWSGWRKSKIHKMSHIKCWQSQADDLAIDLSLQDSCHIRTDLKDYYINIDSLSGDTKHKQH